MGCCTNCFGNKAIKRVLTTLTPTERGECSYCGAVGVDLFSPFDLSEYFLGLIEIYEPAPDGKTLVQWLKLDWGLFSHPRMDDAHSQVLLADILNDGDIVRKPFSPTAASTTDALTRWENFREELMHQNRFFPDVEIDRSRLRDRLSRLVLEPYEIQERWYRARLQETDTPFLLDHMGAPPSAKVSHGRANPHGIPYLYLGSGERGVIAELRPHTAERVTVAQFSIANTLQIVDLRDPRSRVLPFALEETIDIALLRGDLTFLERLGQELTRPVLPQSAAINYLPSQYLCEFVKKCGYDGVMYSSSVSEGVNLALFHPKVATGLSTKEYFVSRVSVDVVEA